MRIDITKKRDTWQLQCPECGSREWRANNGTFECLGCQTAGLDVLEHAGTGEEIARSEIEFVGGESNWKAKYASGRAR